MAKDLFSEQAKLYARYRPSYPDELFDYIMQFVSEKNSAWDCATGNGQAAIKLANYFKQVHATDLSKAQLENAITKQNIIYQVSPAEHTSFAENSFDLITVAQAYHWINWKDFHAEASIVAKAGAVVAIWVYNLFQSNDEKLDRLLRRFYVDIIGSYWDAERKYVDDNYKTVEFDFELLPSKEFQTKMIWYKEDFIGYLTSWSAVQHFKNQQHNSPIDIIKSELDLIWEDRQTKEITFPITLRLGRVTK